MARRICLIGVILMVLLLPTTWTVFAGDEDTSQWYTIIDHDTKKVLMETCHVVVAGDEFIDEDNSRYRVVNVEGHTAWADFIETVDVETEALAFQAQALLRLGFLRAGVGLAADRAPQGGLVAIYHTHSDESYVPTSGSPSVTPHGDVYDVGAVISASLKNAVGLKTVHSWESHLPHDGSAYMRSRRTAISLLKKNPDALLDLHRDAAPLSAYATTVMGKPGAKVMIVLGRQNPNLKANEQFALALKHFADKEFPGFVRGIFYGDGTFNQDLSPRALLFEMGSHENSREAAERVMVNFINSIPAVLYGVTPSGQTARGAAARQAKGEGGVAASTVVWLILLVFIGTAVYLLVTERSISGVKERLRRFAKVEFREFVRVKEKAGPPEDET
ncbi:MAG TPA: stage II sporulation protein P [Bacillota bacterium]|nr:stage II sporulation protein P [Bacillota bacterium]HOL02406.1 stage II sporulation protein P [Bacillota bacterium]HPO80788.1 stage II sporulation protein P [Bacillota bacterium]